MVKILQISSASRICHWYSAPLSQLFHQFFIDTFLQTFIVCCVDQKFGTVWLEGFDGFWNLVRAALMRNIGKAYLR